MILVGTKEETATWELWIREEWTVTRLTIVPEFAWRSVQ